MYRTEEWFKVFLHETMHSLGIDFSSISITDESNMTKKLIDTCFHGVKSNDLRIYEAYTEFWAEFIHILFLVKNRNEITKRIHREREWSLIQANKI